MAKKKPKEAPESDQTLQNVSDAHKKLMDILQEGSRPVTIAGLDMGSIDYTALAEAVRNVKHMSWDIQAVGNAAKAASQVLENAKRTFAERAAASEQAVFDGRIVGPSVGWYGPSIVEQERNRIYMGSWPFDNAQGIDVNYSEQEDNILRSINLAAGLDIDTHWPEGCQPVECSGGIVFFKDGQTAEILAGSLDKLDPRVNWGEFISKQAALLLGRIETIKIVAQAASMGPTKPREKEEETEWTLDKMKRALSNGLLANVTVTQKYGWNRSEYTLTRPDGTVEKVIIGP